MREVEKRVDGMRKNKDKAEDLAKQKNRPVFTMDRPANGLPEDFREHTRLMCDIIAIAFQTDKTRVATLLLARDLSALYYPFLEVREGHHAASHNNQSDGYERIARFHLSQLAYLATKLDSMPEGDGTVLDNSCLMFLSNMWIGRKHDNTRLPLVLAGGLGGTLQDRPHARLPEGRRRESQDVQPVSLAHGSHGSEARQVRRRRNAPREPIAGHHRNRLTETPKRLGVTRDDAHFRGRLGRPLRVGHAARRGDSSPLISLSQSYLADHHQTTMNQTDVLDR